jgi:hypothetical protein
MMAHRHNGSYLSDGTEYLIICCRNFLPIGDYTGGRECVNRARELDPEFCGVGHQEAVLTVSPQRVVALQCGRPGSNAL